MPTKPGRCKAKRHFEIVGDHIEVGCDSRACGKRPGIVVIHTFDRATGQHLPDLDRKFKNPMQERS